MRKTVLGLLAAFLILSGMAVSLPTARAQNIIDLQATIKALLEQVKSLESQIQRLSSAFISPAAPVVETSRTPSIVQLAESLHRGDRGERVTALQERLRKEGVFDIVPTGFFGPLTEIALGRWRSAHQKEEVRQAANVPTSGSVTDIHKLACTPSLQTIASGETAAVRAEAAIPEYVWKPPKQGEMVSIEGEIMRVKYVNNTGSYITETLTVAAGNLTASCTVRVAPVAPAPTSASPSSTPTTPPTPVDPREDRYFIGSGEEGPRITEFAINPLDAKVGEVQKVSVMVRYASPITSVNITVKSDNKTLTFPATLTLGSATEGWWEASWTASDTYLQSYSVPVHAVAADNKVGTVTLTLRYPR